MADVDKFLDSVQGAVTENVLKVPYRSGTVSGSHFDIKPQQHDDKVDDTAVQPLWAGLRDVELWESFFAAPLPARARSCCLPDGPLVQLVLRAVKDFRQRSREPSTSAGLPVVLCIESQLAPLLAEVWSPPTSAPGGNNRRQRTPSGPRFRLATLQRPAHTADADFLLQHCLLSSTGLAVSTAALEQPQRLRSAIARVLEGDTGQLWLLPVAWAPEGYSEHCKRAAQAAAARDSRIIKLLPEATTICAASVAALVARMLTAGILQSRELLSPPCAAAATAAARTTPPLCYWGLRIHACSGADEQLAAAGAAEPNAARLDSVASSSSSSNGTHAPLHANGCLPQLWCNGGGGGGGSFSSAQARSFWDGLEVSERLSMLRHLGDLAEGLGEGVKGAYQVLIMDLVREVEGSPGEGKDPMVFRQVLSLDGGLGALLLEFMGLSRLVYVQRYGEALLEFGNQVWSDLESRIAEENARELLSEEAATPTSQLSAGSRFHGSLSKYQLQRAMSEGSPAQLNSSGGGGGAKKKKAKKKKASSAGGGGGGSGGGSSGLSGVSSPVNGLQKGTGDVPQAPSAPPSPSPPPRLPLNGVAAMAAAEDAGAGSGSKREPSEAIAVAAADAAAAGAEPVSADATAGDGGAGEAWDSGSDGWHVVGTRQCKYCGKITRSSSMHRCSSAGSSGSGGGGGSGDVATAQAHGNGIVQPVRILTRDGGGKSATAASALQRSGSDRASDRGSYSGPAARRLSEDSSDGGSSGTFRTSSNGPVAPAGTWRGPAPAMSRPPEPPSAPVPAAHQLRPDSNAYRQGGWGAHMGGDAAPPPLPPPPLQLASPDSLPAMPAPAPPWHPPLPPPQAPPPLLLGAAGISAATLDALSADVAEMARGLSALAARRRPLMAQCLARLRAVVARVWPAARVSAYGSCATGTAIPASDLDVVIAHVREGGGAAQWWGGLDALGVLAAELGSRREKDWVTHVKTVDKTRVPLIKLDACVAAAGGGGDGGGGGSARVPAVKMDISFMADQSGGGGGGGGGGAGGGGGQESTHRGVLTTTFVQRQLVTHPQLAPLLLVLKQLLVERGLHDPFTGGLSSYALAIMLAALLQQHALKPPDARPGLGAMFAEFLATFGTDFDTRRQGVLVSAFGPLAPLNFLQPQPRVGTAEFFHPAAPVVIQDPLLPTENVGRGCFGFRQVQVAFDGALAAIRAFDAAAAAAGLNGSSGGGGGSTSVLGGAFRAQHHRQVLQLAEQIWCPPEPPPLEPPPPPPPPPLPPLLTPPPLAPSAAPLPLPPPGLGLQQAPPPQGVPPAAVPPMMGVGPMPMPPLMPHPMLSGAGAGDHGRALLLPSAAADEHGRAPLPLSSAAGGEHGAALLPLAGGERGRALLPLSPAAAVDSRLSAMGADELRALCCDIMWTKLSREELVGVARHLLATTAGR